MKLRRKPGGPVFLPVCIFLLFLMITLTSVTDGEDYLTEKDEAYKYSFKYPRSWKVVLSEDFTNNRSRRLLNSDFPKSEILIFPAGLISRTFEEDVEITERELRRSGLLKYALVKQKEQKGKNKGRVTITRDYIQKEDPDRVILGYYVKRRPKYYCIYLFTTKEELPKVKAAYETVKNSFDIEEFKEPPQLFWDHVLYAFFRKSPAGLHHNGNPPVPKEPPHPPKPPNPGGRQAPPAKR